ncbi:radical SAM protein [Prevotella koreensis]
MFCKAPFSYIGLNAGGVIQPCCINSLDIPYADNQSLHDIWFGKEYDDMRKSMVAGGIPDHYYCRYCFQHRAEASCHARSYDKFIVNENGYPSFLKFSCSNRCNLKCVMCNEIFSSQHAGYEVNNFLEEEFVSQLDEFIPYLHTVSFSGGEPLLVKKYLALAKKIREMAPDATIHVTTNGTICTDDVCSILDDNHLFITVSLDSINEDVYASIRQGAHYSKVMENLNIFCGLACQIDVNICLTTQNLSCLPETLFVLSDKGLPVNVIAAKHPLHLSLFFKKEAFIDRKLRDVKEKVDNATIAWKGFCHDSYISASSVLAQIMEYRKNDKDINKDNAEIRHDFSRLLSNVFSEGRKNKDVEKILRPLPLSLFTRKFADNFFEFNSVHDLRKLVSCSNGTIQDFIISNAFYLSI